MTITFGERRATVEDVVAIARDDELVELAPDVLERLALARAVLDRRAAEGQKIYGMNTGLGANLRTEVEDDHAQFQRQLIQGRSGSVGEPMSHDRVRALMAARIAMLCQGGSGLSPHILETLVATLNAGMHPVMPSIGSIGAGDLLLLTPLARMLIAEGDVEYGGKRMPAAEALRRAGIAPVVLGPKDGLSLINSSAASVSHGALVVADTARLWLQLQQAAALTFEAIGANQTILDRRLQEARPAFGQEQAAEGLRNLLEKQTPHEPVTLQDPLSVRCVPSIHGAMYDAIERARLAVEIELNSAADNPVVLPQDGDVISTGNFHTPALSLAFENLGLAIAQAAAACAARFVQLTGSSRHGLPKYLSPVGGASAGFVPLQKTVSAILAAIRHRANPVMLDYIAVSEGVEDVATQSPLTISKCADIIDLTRRLTAFELMASCQAIDLRQSHLADGTASIYRQVRSITAMLHQDRPLGPDVDALHDLLSGDRWQA